MNNFIDRLCIKNCTLPYYLPTIRNKCSGSEFTVTQDMSFLHKKENLVFEMDIPEYLDINLSKEKYGLNKIDIPQYKGYLIDLTKFNGVEELFTSAFSRNPRKNFRSKYRKLEAEHQVTYEFYHGNIEKNEYDRLFEVCYRLMEDRFDQKKIFNRYLLDWAFYHKIFYPKILNKEASIFVIYDGKKPITMTLNFHRSDIVFSYMQIFDTDYGRYSLGDIAMYKNLEWCYENGYKTWDTLKGTTENKIRWSNNEYTIVHHLFYNPSSIFARFKTHFIFQKLRFKQWLRDKRIIGGYLQLDRINYYLKKNRLKSHNWKTD